jgi:4-amino-4-deoxy-L-arabinose transferase-like glycosyltransferase
VFPVCVAHTRYVHQGATAAVERASVIRHAIAWRWILLVAVAELIVEFSFANRYGYHRDELYFRTAARHPAVAYDDQGAVTPMFGWLSEALFGQTPRGLRVFSAVMVSVVVVLVALLARELGAGPVGQLVAAVAAAGSAFLLAVGHLLTTSTFDLLVWTTTLLAVARLLAGGDERLWLVVGAALGLGLENKELPLLFAVSLAIGFALDRRLARVVRSRWLWAGIALGIVLWLPYLAWQAGHGWPQLELAADVRRDEASESRATLIPLQLLLVGPLLAPVLVVGLWGLLRNATLRSWRSLGYAYLALLVVVFVSGGKPYYAGPFLYCLLAAGTVLVERWLLRPVRWAAIGAVLAVSIALSVVVALPVLPADRIGGTPIADLNEDAIETVGWPQLVRTVAQVYEGLPAAERRTAVIFAGNYGEAGAIDRYGSALGLPRAYSAHNAYARFGKPPDSSGPVIVLGYRNPIVDFADCRAAATVDNGVELDNEEQDGTVFVCAPPAAGWEAIWPQLRHLDA